MDSWESAQIEHRALWYSFLLGQCSAYAPAVKRVLPNQKVQLRMKDLEDILQENEPAFTEYRDRLPGYMSLLTSLEIALSGGDEDCQ